VDRVCRASHAIIPNHDIIARVMKGTKQDRIKMMCVFGMRDMLLLFMKNSDYMFGGPSCSILGTLVSYGHNDLFAELCERHIRNGGAQHVMECICEVGNIGAYNYLYTCDMLRMFDKQEAFNIACVNGHIDLVNIMIDKQQINTSCMLTILSDLFRKKRWDILRLYHHKKISDYDFAVGVMFREHNIDGIDFYIDNISSVEACKWLSDHGKYSSSMICIRHIYERLKPEIYDVTYLVKKFLTYNTSECIEFLYEHYYDQINFDGLFVDAIIAQNIYALTRIYTDFKIDVNANGKNYVAICMKHGAVKSYQWLLDHGMKYSVLDD
jgi:hypothetical protein